MARDFADPHESAGHRWLGVTRIRSEQNEEGEWYPTDQIDSERGSEEEENAMHENFQRHLRRGHEAERIRR
jgi:hypothetical protein